MKNVEKVAKAAIDWYKTQTAFHERMNQQWPCFKSEKEYVQAIKKVERSWKKFLKAVQSAQ